MGFWSCLNDVPHRLDWVEAAGVRTRYLEAGPTTDPAADPAVDPTAGAAAAPARTILFIHGVNGHLEVFLKNVRAHARRHRVLAIDLMGHGYSSKPDDRPYEVAQYVEQVLAVLDALKVERACLVGTSLGGWISARIAASAPERVDTLSLVSSGGLTSYAHVMNSLRDLGTRAAADDRAAVRKRLEYVIHDPAKVTDELVDLRAAIYGQADYQRVLPRIFCLQDPETRARNLLTVEELGRVRAPTIVVWTRHDPTATVEDGRRYADAIPGARFEVLEDSSHMPQLEETEKFDALHLAFLEGAAARAVAE